MLKFAFLINVPGQNPETYCGTYENSESFNLVAGTDNMDMAVDCVGDGNGSVHARTQEFIDNHRDTLSAQQPPQGANHLPSSEISKLLQP